MCYCCSARTDIHSGDDKRMCLHSTEEYEGGSVSEGVLGLSQIQSQGALEGSARSPHICFKTV